MQCEETDWTFLKLLVSYFSTFILAGNTAKYGKAYFGIPHKDYGIVLKEEEYTLLRGKGVSVKSATVYSDGSVLRCGYSREGNETHYLYDRMGRDTTPIIPTIWRGGS